MTSLKRVRAAGAYVPAAPAARQRHCPECQAKPGEPCWSTRRSLYPVALKKIHPARKCHTPGGESGAEKEAS